MGYPERPGDEAVSGGSGGGGGLAGGYPMSSGGQSMQSAHGTTQEDIDNILMLFDQDGTGLASDEGGVTAMVLFQCAYDRLHTLIY